MAERSKQESRRTFLKAVPAAMVGAVGAKALAQAPQQNGGPVSVEAIECAEKLVGIDLHSDEETAIAGSLNNRLRTFQQLRQIKIGPEIDPAIMFKPSLPGKEPKGPSTPGAPLRYTRAPLTLKRPANLEEVAFWPVATLAALIERRLVTSTELTRMYLDRLKRYQPTLNFYVTLTEELALQQAADADRDIKAGKYRGPLHGLPWGAKDLLATKGIRTTWGGEPYVEQVFDYDATVVERLRDAGSVLVAKLTLGALAQGDRWFGGRTNSPWNPQRGSSGSSAGPGSATAAGCVAFSIGTETRGSIISPSTANGVVGLRPTYGRVSRYGAMPLSNTMDKIGPMCRYVEDCVLVLNAIYGPDKRDGTVPDAAFRWNPDAPLAGYRIAYVRTGFEPTAGGDGRGAGAPPAAPGGAPGAAAAGRGAGGGAGEAAGRGGGRGGMPVEERRKVYQDVLAVYRKLGATLEPVELPDLSIGGTIGFILETESAASFDDLTRSGDVDLLRTGTSASSWANTFKSARFTPAVEYLRAQRARVLLMRQMDEFMSKYDALLSAGSDSTLGVTNLTGHPAIALKCSIYNSDMPVMLMVTGKLYEEATICRIAMAYEQATDWKDRHPKLT
ncbi:MAG TPA: amidase [Vicinamibacterales bacterium]|nr:amidase [Vicinamibacterales bacterium]